MMPPTLTDWREAFAGLDRCPWAGPRPLGDVDGDENRFKGRQQEASDFKNLVLANQFVVLAGDSGVGKSSFLKVKLRPALRQAGFKVYSCSNWTASTGDSEHGVDSLIRAKMPRQATDDTAPQTEGGPYYKELEAAHDGSVVLIFDQFEELIRYKPQLFAKVGDWIRKATRESRIHIVISLRVEYLHRLKKLERGISAFKMGFVTLEPVVDPDTIGEIVTGTGASMPITDAAAEQLLSSWQESRSGSDSGWSDIGLLHLQGTLYALHAMASPDRVDAHHIERLKEPGADSGDTHGVDTDTLSLFHRGLQEAVRLKLDRCREACRKEGFDNALIEGTAALARRFVPHLSSGGFKLEREEWELTRVSLSRELDRLRPVLTGSSRIGSVEGSIRSAFKFLAGRSRPGSSAFQESAALLLPDSLQVSRKEVLELAGLPVTTATPSDRLRANGVTVAPWEADPSDVSSGPLLGMSAADVLIEELRRAAFAVTWLETAHIVRATSPTASETMLSLIHDGFANALTAWAEQTERGPSEALSLLTAARGETFDWRSSERDRPVAAFDGGAKRITLVNLRWRDCQVSAVFCGVTFANCDFRGTRFNDCRFSGVVFVNCLLDDVSFEECVIVGTTGTARIPPEHTYLQPDATLLIDNYRLPSFRIADIDPALVSELRKYRHLPENDQAVPSLYSRTSGLAAVPWNDDYGNTLPWEDAHRGLTMYGGRLSSLMVRRCGFEEGGCLALRHIAGASLDIVEQDDGGRIDIAGSAIRGLSITAPVQDLRHDRVGKPFHVDVLDSTIANAWFSDGLTGGATFTKCLLWQAISLSNPDNFRVLAPATPAPGTLGAVTQFEPLVSVTGRTFGQVDLMTTDYRSVPARLELTRGD